MAVLVPDSSYELEDATRDRRKLRRESPRPIRSQPVCITIQTSPTIQTRRFNSRPTIPSGPRPLRIARVIPSPPAARRTPAVRQLPGGPHGSCTGPLHSVDPTSTRKITIAITRGIRGGGEVRVRLWIGLPGGLISLVAVV